MSEFLADYRDQLLVFLMVLTRVGGLAVAAPLFGIRQAPKYVRLMLCVGVSMVVAPVYWGAAPAVVSEPGIELVLALCREAILGLVMGLAMLMLAAALQAAGRIVGQMSGASLAETMDPEMGAASPLYGRLYDLVSVAAFLAIGGHRQVLAALLDTFQWMPPGQVGFSSELFTTLNEIASQSFVLAIRAAAPVMVALLLSTLILGLISRAAPQINILAVGFNLNALVAIAVVALTLGGTAWIFQQYVDAAVQSIQTSFVALLE